MRVHVMLASIAVLSSLTATGAAPARRPELSLEDRVEAQRAIEQVYWSHRTWPEGNPGPKPRLSWAMSDKALRGKVEDYLKKSNALAEVWGRPITAAQLQAEMTRMSRGTQAPDVLRELLAALGDDPALIAETLVRQKLVERLLRHAYAYDARLHGQVRREAERAIASADGIADLKSSGGEYQETTWRRIGETRDVEKVDKGGQPIVGLDAKEWKELLHRGPRFPRLEETEDGFVVTAVLSAEAEEVTTASVTWSKTTFDSWWMGERERHGTALGEEVGTYELVLPSEINPRDADTWRTTFDPKTPQPRYRHTAVWTGAEMIVWGGFYGGYSNTGSRYDPAADTWTPTAETFLEGRYLHTAVWTGTEMIIWGGNAGPYTWNSGGRYDPSADTWAWIPAPDTEPRSGHTAVWTGSEMIVWGGRSTNNTELKSGARYLLSKDAWMPTSTGLGDPSARSGHTAVWTGTEMIVWGGGVNTGGRYNPGTDSWVPTSTGTGVPSARSGHTVVWTEKEMIVWGGGVNTGSRYNPKTNTWNPTSTGIDVPSARSGHTAVWTGTEMIVWGGGTGTVRTGKGGRYDPATNHWTGTSTEGEGPSARWFHTAVWTGREMIVWGGQDATGDFVGTGGRYDPSTGTWVATSKDLHVPAPRSGHTAVWTGAEMIVWGGLGSNSGGRYDPSTDTWLPTSRGPGVPAGGFRHTAVWTGEEMIVWGGSSLNSGGRYDPSTDTWTPTALVGAPAGRSGPTAVWTGTEMIVWGGVNIARLNSGGRYDPSTNTWAPTSTAEDVPAARSEHTAVWTGSRMIIWGGAGSDGYALASGGRYDPSTDTWAATSLQAAPTARFLYTAIWTGTEMIVWGGYAGIYGPVNDGGRYNPFADTWSPTTTESSCPTQRYSQTAVWTGTEMIIWGGGGWYGSYENTGGRYDPLTDSWVPTSNVDTPTARVGHTAVWTGTSMIVWGGYPWTPVGWIYSLGDAP